jgi:hypothetical protein
VQATDEIFFSVSTPDKLGQYTDIVVDLYKYSSTGNEVPDLHGDYKYAMELPANCLLDSWKKELKRTGNEKWLQMENEEAEGMQDPKQKEVAIASLGTWGAGESGASPSKPI